jgi:hypothetical protein
MSCCWSKAAVQVASVTWQQLVVLALLVYGVCMNTAAGLRSVLAARGLRGSRAVVGLLELVSKGLSLSSSRKMVGVVG